MSSCNPQIDADAMAQALAQAQQAAQLGEVPIGAVLMKAGVSIAAAYNDREKSKNPLRHAEIQVLEAAARTLGDWRLSDCTLYVTLEPCPMCLGALLQARVGRLVFGCYDEKREKDFLPGKNIIPNLRALQSLTSNNHTLQITGGLMSEACAKLLKDFFTARRNQTLPSERNHD